MYKKLILPAVVILALLAGSTQADLVAHWTFDEGSGTVAEDFSGNGNDGTLEGDPQWVAGQIGGALEFDGSGDYVSAPYIPLDNRSFTVTMWVNPVLYTGEQIVFSQRQTSATNTDLHFRLGGPGVGGGNVPVGGVRMGFYSNDLDTPGGLIEDNNWYHITFWYDFENQNRRIYIDGELQAEAAATPYLGTSGNTVIGSWAGSTQWFQGIIDDVRVYDHPLSEAEIMGAMQGEAWPYALGPQPKSGDMITTTFTTLAWRAGDFAALHDVYFGESFEEVEAATPDDPNVFVGRQVATQLSVGTAGEPAPEGLVPGQTYYWRVDEVNDLDPNSPWKGEVWSFWVQPLIAYDPSPADGVPYAPLDPQLTWEGGMGVLFHTVYFGDSFEAVDAMAFGGWMTAAATIAPAEPTLYGPLQPETTYYWRVDEFTMTATTNKGEIWSFTTVPEVPVTDPDLTGWWTLDEGMGGTAVDWSGHGHHGTLIGEPQWVDGYLGGALDFDGGDYVTTGKSASDLEIGGNSPRTVTAWVFTRSFGNGGIYDVGNRVTGQDFCLRTLGNEDNRWRVQYWGGDFDFSYPSKNEWVHFAHVHDGTNTRIYADGSMVVDWEKTIDTADTNPFQIGRYGWPGNDFDGVIDDVRVYKKVLTETEIATVMRGNPLLAGSPNPSPGAVVDIRDATMLSWAAGDTAVSHDVYFGTDRAAVAAADNGAPEFQGNQPGTSASLAGLVEFGGGDYFWRIDEVEAAGTVQTGYIWKFTIPDYLIVDDFESYTNDADTLQRLFQTWIDGIGFSEPAPGQAGNGTGALVGHDIWTPGTPYTQIVETGNVHGGSQAMPIYYDNTSTPFRSEADRTFTPGQNWTIEGVTTLVVHFRGDAANTGDLYVEINGVKVPYDGDPADIASSKWVTWEINLAAAGVPATNVTTMTIGIENGQSGVLYVDDILLTRP